jgi:hypothetical protein
LGDTTALLTGTNAKLDGMSLDLRRTVGGLNGTNAQLRQTNRALADMLSQIRAMTHKITHAKLLF